MAAGAVLGLILPLVYQAISGQKQKEQNMMSQATAMNQDQMSQNQPLTLEGIPVPQAQEAQGTLEDVSKSAYNRKIATFDKQIEVTEEAPMVEQLPLPIEDSPLQQGAGYDSAQIAGFDPTELAMAQAEVPPGTIQPEKKSGMTGLEMAQLGLALGSMMFQGQPGPRPPSLPGNSFSPMRPVFRG
ncbi:MAG TPA: hypothetical protein VMW79_07920 [Anaerolineae bacterium]|nr:hypothetical protein [Anaerolineae bacterium]